MKSILVTGAAGFIGSHLCEHLISMGYQVIGLDNFNKFYNPRIKQENIAQLVKGKNFSLITGDIRHKKIIDSLFFRYSPSMIIHLAAMAGVRPSIKNPALYTDVNLNGTVNLLEACRKFGVNKFIFASSSSVSEKGTFLRFP
jgi:UDP-glucuronate 4-epimerase